MTTTTKELTVAEVRLIIAQNLCDMRNEHFISVSELEDAITRIGLQDKIELVKIKGRNEIGIKVFKVLTIPEQTKQN